MGNLALKTCFIQTSNSRSKPFSREGASVFLEMKQRNKKQAPTTDCFIVELRM